MAFCVLAVCNITRFQNTLEEKHGYDIILISKEPIKHVIAMVKLLDVSINAIFWLVDIL